MIYCFSAWAQSLAVGSRTIHTRTHTPNLVRGTLTRSMTEQIIFMPYSFDAQL